MQCWLLSSPPCSGAAGRARIAGRSTPATTRPSTSSATAEPPEGPRPPPHPALLVFGLFYAINKSAQQFAPPEASADELPGAQTQARREAALRPAATGVAKLSEDTQTVGGSLYRYGGLPFEIASVLLLVAIVGSVLLARTAKQELAADDVDPKVIEELETTGELTPTEVEEALRAPRR